jgi:hypothetical protein
MRRGLVVIHADVRCEVQIATLRHPLRQFMLSAGAHGATLLDFGATWSLIGDMTQALTTILKPAFAPADRHAQTQGIKPGARDDVCALAAVSILKHDSSTLEPSWREAASRAWPSGADATAPMNMDTVR